MDQDIQLLHQKIDHLTAQMDAQRLQERGWDELKRDAIPIANHMVKLTIDELAEIGSDFELEDLMFLLKRVLRDTRRLTTLLDRLEAFMALGDEVNLIGRQAFNNTVESLDRLEREGYFAFARGGLSILQRVVEEFEEEDVRALGDNIVTILTTVRNMTQPEVLMLANNAISAIAPQEQETDISAFRLLRELSNPQVRRGMARLLNIVKSLAEEPGNGREG